MVSVILAVVMVPSVIRTLPTRRDPNSVENAVSSLMGSLS